MLADSGAAAFRLLSPGRGATATGVAFAGAPFFPRNRCGERAILLRCRMLACGCGTGRRVFMPDRLAVAFSLVSKGKQIGCCRVTELWTLHLDSCTVQNVHSAHFICTMHSPTGSPTGTGAVPPREGAVATPARTTHAPAGGRQATRDEAAASAECAHEQLASKGAATRARACLHARGPLGDQPGAGLG